MQKIYIFDCLGAPWPPFFFLISPQRRPKRQSYRSVQPGNVVNRTVRRFQIEKRRTVPVSEFRTDFGQESEWEGGVSCNLSLGSGLVSWFGRKQKSVTSSSVETEYMAASHSSCEAIWLRKTLVGLFGQELPPTGIHCDNQSCIKLSMNPVFHDRSKHVEIIYHFIREEQCSCSINRLTSRLQTSSPRPCQGANMLQL
jgi:hypothetical protein